MKRGISILLTFITIMFPLFPVLAISFMDDYNAIEKASSAVLYLETDDDYSDEYYTTGSGFIAFDDKTFVTNYHVIEDAVRITAYDEDYREYEVGEILAVDKERDIAIISFKSSTPLPPLTLAVNKDLKRGQPVATIGYPKGLFNTFSTGIISAIIDYKGKKEIQFTAPISHGSSGGALFNEYGEVIGITSSIIEDGQNINFAVDISHVIDLYRQNNPNYTPYKASTTINPRTTPKPTEINNNLVPTNLNARVLGDTVVLSWSAVQGRTSYRIYRSTSADAKYDLIGSTESTAFEDKNVQTGETYFYKVSSMNSLYDISDKSGFVKATIPNQVFSPKPKPTEKPNLPAPRNLNAVVSGQAVTLTWSSVEGADRYRIYRTDDENGSYYLVGGTTKTSYVDETRQLATVYYRVTAVSDSMGIASAKSNILEVSFVGPTLSPKPTEKPKMQIPNNLKATIADNSVKLTWSEVTGALEYRVYRYSSENGVFVYKGSSTTATFIDKSVTEGGWYYYSITSGNLLLGESDKSDRIKIYIPMPTLIPMPSPSTAPINFISPEETAKYKTLTVGTNDPDVARLKERMYELGYFKNKTVNNTFTATTAEYVKEFQRVNGLKVDGIASPEMQALFFSDYAIPKPSPTPTTTPRLSKPTNVKASISGTTVTITWKAVPGAEEYRVYRSDPISEFRKLIGEQNDEYRLLGTVTVNKYIDFSARKGDTYHYKVESVNGKNVSDKSTYAKVVMPKPTPTPYLEPKYPLEIGDYAYWNEYSSYVSFNPKVTNTSEKTTIDGFTITFYCENIYEEKINYNWTSNTYSEATYSKTVKPSSSVFVGYTDITGYSGIEYIYAAVTKMHTTDGRTITIPESEWNRHFDWWKID